MGRKRQGMQRKNKIRISNGIILRHRCKESKETKYGYWGESVFSKGNLQSLEQTVAYVLQEQQESW